MSKTESSTIKINLNAGILQNAVTESQRIGISLQDFIRMLLATYFSHSSAINSISRDKFLLERAKREIKNKEFKSFKNVKDFEKYLLEL